MQSTIAKVRYEGQEYRDYMQDLDIRRRSKHILVTDAVNVLNRISEAFGVGQIFPTERVLDGNNREDREVAVNLVYNFCTQVYLDEIERSKYNIENKDMHHELHRMSERGGTFHSERVYNGDDFER